MGSWVQKKAQTNRVRKTADVVAFAANIEDTKESRTQVADASVINMLLQILIGIGVKKVATHVLKALNGRGRSGQRNNTRDNFELLFLAREHACGLETHLDYESYES